MTKVSEQILSADHAICQNIQLLGEQRKLLSQNVISQLRNLIEGVAVRLHLNNHDAVFHYDAIEPAMAFVKSKADLSFLGKFHKLIQKSASHYTLDGDASERLMLKYYEYLHRVRDVLERKCGMRILANLEDFPVDLDPSLREYHEKIAARIKLSGSTRNTTAVRDRYYIHHTRPFFVNGQIYYEVTFYRAANKVNKFDRLIAFTPIEMSVDYSAMLTLQTDSIEVFGQTMPITIIREWEVSVRPCEFENFARLLGINASVRTNSLEYQNLMRWLTVGMRSLVDLIDMSDTNYAAMKAEVSAAGQKPQIYPFLDKTRQLARAGAAGGNILRYLMLRVHNRILKSQYSSDACPLLSEMKIQYGCIPFDKMPFCTSLVGHNPRHSDLVECLDATDRKHEFLAKTVKNNVEKHGILYTPTADLEEFGDVEKLVNDHNRNLYYKHASRQLVLDRKHIFIKGYEDETVAIIEALRKYASSRIDGYTHSVERWLAEARPNIDDPAKIGALKWLFSHSRVALLHGAAGTGKSTMVDHIARYFNDKQKLFLAHTHPAVDNLKRKVTSQSSEFRTINSQIGRRPSPKEYDVLIIDECSTVSNSDILQVLNGTSFKLLVLVGDVYQIESIQFGNWFEIIRSFIPSTSVFELTTPFRTKNNSLLALWDKVRSIDNDIAEFIAHSRYSTNLDKSLFQALGEDEIILCLNYDGLYGINNINRFLQSSNPGKASTWRATTYKIGDPVLFNDTERFRPVIYNNLKGRIIGIEHAKERIQFDIELDRPLTEFDVDNDDLEWICGSTVRFSVFDSGNGDDDDDELNTSVPFQVAYAVSIHKAQGLEYDSVKVVITDASEEEITHSIFYTAITRAREHLRIFWTPETQHAILQRLSRGGSSKDVNLLASRRNLTRVK